MSHLVGPVPTLALALCLLVIVGSLPALPAVLGARRRLAPLLLLLAIVGTSATIWQSLERPGTLPDTYMGHTAKYAAAALSSAEEPTVLVIDGGSYVLNAVDCDDLMAELKKLGYPVRAVRMAAGAANHFERFRLHQRVVKRLSPKRPGQRWIFLAETQLGYDTSPVTQFTENPNTNRAYDYSTLPNAWYAAAALRSPGVEVPEEWRWALFRSTLINSFSAGALRRLADEATMEPGGGKVNRRPRSRFKFRGLRKQLHQLRYVPQPEVLPWLKSIRERRTRRLWRPFVDELVYFGVPSTSPSQLAYIRRFCAGAQVPCLAPADATLLGELDNAKYWRDASHMMKEGATIYSRWLAHQLVERGIVK